MGRAESDIELLKKKEKKPSNRGKYIALTILVLLALSITFIVLYVQKLNEDPTEGYKDINIRVCMEAPCVTAASSLITSMNRNVDPCDDFFEFACGGWNKIEVMPDDKSRWQVFDVLRRNLNRNLRGALTAEIADIPADEKPSATEKMQKYFHTCMDAKSVKDDSITTLLVHLRAHDNHLGSWPFTTLPVGPPLSVPNVVRVARAHGNSLGFIPNYVDSNAKDPSYNEINFSGGEFTLSRGFLTNSTIPENVARQEAYVTFGAKVAVLFRERLIAAGVTLPALDQTAAENMFSETLKIEIALATATLTPAESRNSSVFQNPQTLENFAEYTAEGLEMDVAAWIETFKEAWGITDAMINASTIVNVRQPKYYEKLKQVTTTDTTISRTALFNLLGWKVIEPFVPRLDEGFRDIYEEFFVAMNDATPPPRPETCVDLVNAHFPNAVGSLYVRNFYRKEARAELNKMIDYLIEAFRNIVKESYWMEEATRKNALEKVDKIQRQLAYEDYLVDDIPKLDQEHRTFIATTNFMTNYLSGRRFDVKQAEGKRFTTRNQKTDWITGAAVVNAFYSPNHNSISFPAGFLQAPFLGEGFPQYWNYAALGTVIGHEITHGFDDEGSQSDGDGSLRNWWDPVSRARFEERAKDIVHQYSLYNYLGFQLNGVANQGENIADNGGLKESYNAYQLFRKDPKGLNGTEEYRLPGFEDFNTDQMFYLSYSQIWCGDYRPKAMAQQVDRPHSPGRFRVIGPLQNSAKFAQAYRCAPKSYMNPDQKNAVW